LTAIGEDSLEVRPDQPPVDKEIERDGVTDAIAHERSTVALLKTVLVNPLAIWAANLFVDEANRPLDAPQMLAEGEQSEKPARVPLTVAKGEDGGGPRILAGRLLPTNIVTSLPDPSFDLDVIHGATLTHP